MLINKFLFFILLFSSAIFAKGMPKEYFEIKDREKQKIYFFEYIYKLSKNENEKILKERNFVKNVLNSNLLNIDTNSDEFLKLLKIKKKYRIKKLYDLKSYMSKIDVIPPALSLSQAAIESGWGKSRFVKEANNIFGHWTYSSKIGMIPKQRNAGAKHFIRVFKTMQASVNAYMLNLNRNNAYKAFHKKRYAIRLKNKKPTGLELSQTMINYSGIAEEYLRILKKVILKNNLKKYDKRFYQQIK
ncbi:glucosaminidase domain-containing protein [Arcobacter peruensis]|uniref:glucosaminidase domain-containing protein n=1 Tax=Arcobacter peruensis TaxID=2320140 RepID=UPI000F08525D|nr:glucosaminidase domain-containing protein [Arcobacter peruensis]